jgi:Trp operon repressor
MNNNIIDISPKDQRVIEIAKRICESYDAAEIKTLVNVSPTTIQRWAEGANKPVKQSLSAVPYLLSISDQLFDDYLNGDITLDELWEKRGSARRIHAKEEVSIATIVNDAKTLSTMELLKAISQLILLLSPAELNRSHQSIPYIVLQDNEKKRLKSLIEFSNLFRGQNFQSIIESGADKALVESIEKDLGNDFTLEVYETLLPFVCVPEGWNELDKPIILSPSVNFKSVHDLLECIKQSKLTPAL